jgi:hypothetical protein
MSVNANFKVDVGAALSNDTFTGRMKQGVVSKLVGSLPEVKIRGEQFFDLSARTKGEVVGQGDEKSPTPTAHPLRNIRTTKIHYTERFTDEFLILDKQEQLGILNRLVEKWLQSDFLRDLDTIIIHGINPLTGTQATSIVDWIAKSGSSVDVPATSASASDIDAAITTAVGQLSDDWNVNGFAFSNSSAAKLASLRGDDMTQKYPELGAFGLNVTSFAGVDAASSKEVGEFNGVQAIVGDWTALRYGLAAEMPVKLIEYGDPDGLGDLQRQNEVALRFEAIVGFGIANPTALAVISTDES